jgi:hypothetical protein
MHSALTSQQSAFIQRFQMAKPNPYKIINKITTLAVLSKFFSPTATSELSEKQF